MGPWLAQSDTRCHFQPPYSLAYDPKVHTGDWGEVQEAISSDVWGGSGKAVANHATLSRAYFVP